MRSLLLVLLGGLLLPAAAFLAGAAGLLPVAAAAPPPGWEVALADVALEAGLRRSARGLRNPVRAGDPAAFSRGNCAGCHGSSAGPSSWGSRNFYPRVPQFLQQRTALTPEQAFVAVRDGIRYSGMGAWRGMMNERDMWLVANFVSRAGPPSARPG